MIRAHKIRMYPTREQEVQLRKTAGTSRYAYNWALAKWKAMYEAFDKGESLEKPSAFKLSNTWTQERPEWATETAYCAQNRAIMNVGTAFQNLWRGRTKYPQFHKKGTKDSFYVANDKAWIKDKVISLPKIGRVRLAEKLRFKGKIQSYTVSTYADQWHVSVQVEVDDDLRPRCEAPQAVVGIDVGLKHVAVSSDGTVLDTPASVAKLQRKLKYLQRCMAKKQKTSNRRLKLLVRKQKVQNKINNIRTDCVHKFTTTIAKSHGIVVVEDLDIKDMAAKAKRLLRRSFATSLMTEVHRQLEYKAQVIRKVPRTFPSSKMCSSCGHIKDHLCLDERTYVCGNCGAVIDRDVNAAINLMNAGLVKPGEPVESTSTR